MRFITRSSIAAFVICLVALSGAVRPAAAQTSWSVSSAADLTAALAGAFNNNVANPSLLNTITLTGTISGTSQWIVNANVNIIGNGYTIDMQSTDRAFFIAGGTVGITNLLIKNGFAQGGAANDGGGGGAGLGGAIFVGSGTYYGGVDPVSGTASVAALGISAPQVTLSGVAFRNNTSSGGNSALCGGNSVAIWGGGGGGMGGDGGQQNSMGLMALGGGGFGVGATGGGYTGAPTQAGSGAMVNVVVPSGATTTAGSGGNGGDSNGSPGGLSGGGGGGGGGGFETFGTGGGGGVGGGRGYFANGDPPTGGGNGGFGGGGGGGAQNGLGLSVPSGGGAGGFGGGGGCSPDFYGGAGGFGGGGGGGGDNSNFSPGPGGFGAGRGSFYNGDSVGGGGGGLGAGGAIFVMNGASLTVTSGTFAGNAVASGTGWSSGSAYGADLFLGADVTFDVPTTLALSSLGGAGNTSDVNITNNYGLNLAGDPNANGGLIKTGVGTLTLTGTSFYAGITTVHSGTLALAPGAKEQGTTVVTIGQNAGDVATLGLGSSSSLFLGGFNVTTPSASTDQPVMIAQAAGSTGTVVIGNGAGSNGADIGARVFTGGAGNASVVFTQQYWAAGTNPVYPFYTSLTGSLDIVQEGLGTTSLQPLYGPNTFAGPVTVNAGTLATTGTAAALAGTTSIAVNAGGTLLLGQTGGVNDAAAITLAGGVLRTGVSLSETLGALNITTGGSIIDFLGTASTLNFSTLSLGGPLSIWNYAGANDFLNINSGTATGSLAQIEFFSDSGSTFLGWGGFEGTQLVPVPVPEPSTVAMALAGLACGGFALLRRRRVLLPVALSPSRRLSSEQSGDPVLSFESSVFSLRKGSRS